MTSPESYIEKITCDALRKLGVFTIKVAPVSHRGIPDRLLLLPNGKCVFVEFKAAHGVLSQMQKLIHTKIRNQGFEVIVARTKYDVTTRVEELLE